MKIFNVNRKMPFSASLTMVGCTDKKSFGRMSRTYRLGGLMFTVTASEADWKEFDNSSYSDQIAELKKHLSDEDGKLLSSTSSQYCELPCLSTARKVLADARAAVEDRDAAASLAAAEKNAAEAKKKAEEAEAAKEAEHQQKIAELVIATLKQCGLDPAAMQNTAVEAPPAAPQVAPTTIPANATNVASAATAVADVLPDMISAIVTSTLAEYGIKMPTTQDEEEVTDTKASDDQKTPITPATQQTATAPADPPADTTAPPEDNKSKGNAKKK